MFFLPQRPTCSYHANPAGFSPTRNLHVPAGQRDTGFEPGTVYIFKLEKTTFYMSVRSIPPSCQCGSYIGQGNHRVGNQWEGDLYRVGNHEYGTIGKGTIDSGTIGKGIIECGSIEKGPLPFCKEDFGVWNQWKEHARVWNYWEGAFEFGTFGKEHLS